MASFLNIDNERQILPRNPLRRSGPIPESRIEEFLPKRSPSIVQRQDATASLSSSSATLSCGPKDTTGPCERPVDGTSNTTIPIVLGIVLPLGVAFIVLLILHRRHVKKLRREDAEDEQKSLDFGLGEGGARKVKGQKKSPEMATMDDKNGFRRDRGLSMDLGMTNPYLLPPELNRSRESIHSLSRSLNPGDDKYRATTFIPDDGSIRSPSDLRGLMDDSSSFTGSSRRKFDTESNKTLIRNAQDYSKSGSSPPNEFQPSEKGLPTNPKQNVGKALPPIRKNNFLAPQSADPTRASFVSTASSNGNAAAFRASNDYLGAFIRGGGLNITDSDTPNHQQSTDTAARVQVRPPSEDVTPPPPVAKVDHGDQKSVYSLNQSRQHERQPSEPKAFQYQTSSEPRETRLPDFAHLDDQTSQQNFLQHQDRQNDAGQSFYSNTYNQEVQNLPLTQQTHQSYDDPMQHSNHPEQSYPQSQRQSSLYHSQNHNPGHDSYTQDQNQAHGYETEAPVHETEDDYYEDDHLYDYEDVLGYDPRRLTMGMRPLPPDDPSENPEQRANRIRSFYKEYFDETSKPDAGQRVEYFDGSEHYDDVHNQGYYDHQQSYYPPPGSTHRSERHRATVSNGSYMSGPRAYSSASGRYGPNARRMQPKKRLPPPKPLNVLPTPYLLKDDSLIPMDFAPPNRARFQRSGTPDSLRGGVRPFSPSTRAHVPLVSSFDDLSVIPSPHALRKSGAFTALDFAPPPRLKGGDSGSETGSIRSNRSGVSAMHLQNIRKGAYRVSRIPKEVAGTKYELAESLRPQWDMSR